MPKSRHDHRKTPPTLLAALVAIAAAGLQADDDTTPKAEPAKAAELLTLSIEEPHLGVTHVGDAGIRYFVAEVTLTNHAERPLKVAFADFELLVDGVSLPPDLKFSKLTGYNFRRNGRLQWFRKLERTESLTLSPEESDSAWIVFSGLPKSADIPQLTLQLAQDSIEYRIDVTDVARQALQLRLERIGPRGVLGLLMIEGQLDTINVGTLVDTIDDLVGDGVSRIVVGFGSGASEVEEPLGSWLVQTAEGVQTSRTYAMFPAVSSTIREFHLGDLPGQRRRESNVHIHQSVAAAVETALASVYRGMTPAEIVTEIEQGHPLAQASALVSGGPDLPDEYLPVLQERAQSSDRLQRRGALIALSGSGDDAALQTLADQSRSEDSDTAELALECLAASRYAGAHQMLKRLLGERLSVDQAAIVRILARYPRQDWADYLSKLALNDSTNIAPDVRREVIAALGKTGHPELTRILRDALAMPDPALQQAAFQLLLRRRDPQSEETALNFALMQLPDEPPTSQMLQLFDRVRDPRIAPLLMPYLDDDMHDRTAIINTLARIGPTDIDDELADRYERLKSNEQATVLINLAHLRSPRLLKLAASGLASEHHHVFRSAVRALGLLGDEEAVEALSERLETETESSRIGALAKALEDIGLPQAMNALEVARNQTSDSDHRRIIAGRLQSLRMKSPGGGQLAQAERSISQKDHTQAIEHYTLALKLDPDLAPAYSGRGHCHLQLKDYPKAAEDFRQCIALDPDDGLAVAGLGITQAIEGQVDQAIKTVEDVSKRFEDDPLFAYNAACVYGRALESISKQRSIPEREQRKQKLADAALSRLARSMELGFDDVEYMQQDPDLASLRELKGFRKLVEPTEESDSESADEDTGNDKQDDKDAIQIVPGER